MTKDSSDDVERIIPPRGNYQALHSFHKAEVVYDITFRFAHKYLLRGGRAVDQDFLKDGGLRERMTRALLAYRNRQGGPA